MVRRLLRGGHQCVVYNQTPEPTQALAKEGAIPSSSLSDFASAADSMVDDSRRFRG